MDKMFNRTIDEILEILNREDIDFTTDISNFETTLSNNEKDSTDFLVYNEMHADLALQYIDKIKVKY
jgi:hypothetical protein